MKKAKRITALFIAVLLVATSLGFTVCATSKTADDAITWVKNQCGKSIDYDGVYGAQCVDLIKAYYNYLGVSPVSGNGKDYVSNALPSGWLRVKDGQPQKGDILVYTNGNYGHVAIYESDYSHYHQNYNGMQYVYNVVKHTYNWSGSSYWGYIRPNFASSATTDEKDTTPSSYNGVSNRIYSLESKFPDGMYWNHLAQTTADVGLSQKKDERFAESVTTQRCATHSANAVPGQYECNYFDGGIQCFGFARKIFYDVFGIRVSQCISQGLKRTDYQNIQVGDYVRFGTESVGHSFIVLSKSGNNVTALECNAGDRDIIRWGRNTYDLQGTIKSSSGSTYSFNYFIHSPNYDDYIEKPETDENINAFNNSKTAVNKLMYVSLENQMLYATPSFSGTVVHPTVNDYTLSVLPVRNIVYVDYLGINASGEKWYHLEATTGTICDQIGGYYVNAAALEDVKPGEYKIHYDLKKSVALRSGNSKSDSIITTMPANAQITVTEISGTWAKANYNGQSGWVILGYTVWDHTTHIWDSGKETTPATHTSTGTMTYTCTVCGATKTETIPKLDDSFTVNVNSVSVQRGGTFTVTFNYGNIDGIRGLGMWFNYDTNVFEFIDGKCLLPDTTMFDVSIKDGLVAAFATPAQTGNAAQLTFKVKSSAEAGKYDIKYMCIGEDSSYKMHSVTICGSVNVTDYIRGDVNNDGKVNSADAIHLLRSTMLPERYSINQSCDMNGDGAVNSADAIHLLRHTMLKDKYPLAEG